MATPMLLEPFTIGNGNFKLNKNENKIATFGLLAGDPKLGGTCPGANECMCTAVIDQETGRKKVVKGDNMKFPCFASKTAARYKNVFDAQIKNKELIEQLEPNELVDHFVRSFYHKADWDTKLMRWFWSGDCYSIKLRDAVFQVAREIPKVIHYSYTKNLPIFKDIVVEKKLPDNYRLTASWHGKFDYLMPFFPRSTKVFATEELAVASGLPIDRDESIASGPVDQHFCLIEH